MAMKTDANVDGGRVELGVIDVPANTTAMSIVCLFDTTLSNDTRIISKSSDWQEQNHKWMLGINAGQLRARLNTQDWFTSTLQGGATVNDGNLHMGAFTYDDARPSDGTKFRLHRDGSPIVASVDRNGAVTLDAARDVWIADNPVQSFRRFTGTMYDLRVYLRGLTNGELDTIWQTRGADKILDCWMRYTFNADDSGRMPTTAGYVKDSGTRQAHGTAGGPLTPLQVPSILGPHRGQ